MENTPVEKTASENPNGSSDEPTLDPENSNPNPSSNPNSNPNPTPRTPFTSLGQVDADLALARALQEQERAYMMLRMDGVDGGGYGSSDSGSYVYEDELDGNDNDDGDHENENHQDDGDDEGHLGEDHGSVEGSDYGEDAFDANEEELELNPANFDSDEAFARALQDAEEREMAVRLMAIAGLNDLLLGGVVERQVFGERSQDAWQEMDPDEYSYEELIALGEAIGTESRGLSSDAIASLPSVNYKAQSAQDGNTEQCVICRLEYEDGESLVALSCKHLYHPECINQWLQTKKVCPICSSEVSTSSSGQ